jgi:HprK-related kinase A
VIDNSAITQGQLILRIGTFNVRLESVIPSVVEGIGFLYQDYPVLPKNSFADYFVKVIQPTGIRRFWRKQAIFTFDQFQPFKPLPYVQALPFFEWGLNWCISGFAHQYLIIHAAVVEKYGRTLVLPGNPGAGKSTLCAALINSGWRLLSDELTLIDCDSGLIFPVPRPVSLKNDSIDLIKQEFSNTQFTESVHDTGKGTVALMKPPKQATSQEAMAETALPGIVIFPSYNPDIPLKLEKISKAETFMKLADLSFNYSVLGAKGFNVVSRFVEQSCAFRYTYDGNLQQAMKDFEGLLAENGA